jgi:arabinofuranan 3-O-arabinosyltransferase
VAIWASTLVVIALDLRVIHDTWWLGSDLQPTLASIGDLVHGRPLDHQFVYPPSVLLLGLPFAAVQHHGLTANYVLLAIEIASLIIGFWATTRAVGRTVGDATIAAIALMFALSGQAIYMLQLENLSAFLVCAVSLFYVLAVQDQWDWAAVALGVSFAIKPMLIPLLAILILEREWRALAISLAIPVALNLAVVPFVPDLGAFLHQAVSLTVGKKAAHEASNANLGNMALVMGLSKAASLLIRILVGLASLVCSARAWVRSQPGSRRIMWTGSLLIAGVLCCTSETHPFYPLMLMSVAFVAAKERSHLAPGMAR